MRTDVKVSLICAFAIVLCVVIYFVARGNSHPTVAKAITTPALTTASAASSDPFLPAKPLASATPGNNIGGPLISMPGGGTSANTPTAATTPSTPVTPALSNAPTTPILATTPLSGTTPTTPGMSPSASSSTPTTPTTPVLSTTPLIPGTPALGPTLELTPMPGSSGTTSLTGAGNGATTYKIQKGDMLGTIAHKFNVSVKAVEAANPGIDSSRLNIDTVIKIPANTATAGTKPVITTPGTATSRTTVAAGKPVTTGTATAATIKPGTTYMVKKGDTLSTIAKAAYGTKGSWKKLYQANQKALADPDVVPVGTQIVIP